MPMPTVINQNRVFRPSEAFRNSVILIVDDEPVMREIMFCVFDPFGAKVLIASSGAEAMEILDRNAPDAVISDIMMPGMDGCELCAAIRAQKRFSSLPIIAVTANQQKDGVMQVLQAGANDYVEKPFDVVELRARADNLIQLKIANDRLRRSEKLRGHVIDILAHDLCHPLTCMRLQLEIWEEERDALSIATSADTLKHQINKVDSMVGMILKIARGEPSSDSNEMKLAALNSCLEQVVSTGNVAQYSSKHCFRWIPSQKPIYAKIDKNLIERAVENLLDNAVKYSPDGGEIELRLVRLSEEKAVIQVSDQGIGISDADKRDVLGRFATGETEGVEVKQTGLGLHLCSLAAEFHGGAIRLRDNSPAGTVVEFELTCVRQEAFS